MKRFIAIILNIVLLCSLLPITLPTQAADGPKLLAITFDDGPSQYTEQLLDGLEARKAKATFFMVGPNVSRYPELIKRMKAEGHQLATHTMSHAYLPKLSEAKIREEVEGVDQRISEIIGEGKYYLRPPYGAFNKTVKTTVKAPLIHWSLDTEDWRYRNSSGVYQAIMRSVSDGDIILLHDLYKTSVEGALQAIDTLQGQGYVFVTVEQLLRRRGITPEDGVVYFEAPNKGINLPAVVAPVIALRDTVVGSKVVIQKFTPQDLVYYTEDGATPDDQCPQYSRAFYIKKDLQISAVSVGESELSDIIVEQLSPRARPTKDVLDQSFYRYRCSFPSMDRKFVVGMAV